MHHTTRQIHEGIKTQCLMDFKAIKNMKYILKDYYKLKKAL